jgi:thioredoxin-dependent peroxiredoxin
MRMKKFLMSLLGLAAAGALAAEVGKPAPDFEADSTAGGKAKLADYKGSWLVLFFYPKSFTPGCTKEACSLRDGHAGLQAMGIKVLGVSLDNLETQKKFKAEYKLPFELLADTDKKVAAAYDALTVGGLVAARVTFVIDPDGKLAAVIKDVNTASHDAQVKAAVEKLKKPEEKK